MCAKKVAVVDIRLTGLNTIDKLEKELRDVNEQLKQVDINSQEFDELQKRAQNADAKLRTVNDTLKGLTSQQRATAIKDMGMGLVGAFQIAASASLVFGEQTSEAIQKAQANVVALFNAIDGLEKVTKMFTGDSLKMFKSIGLGFKSLVVSAKGASLGIKAALISTGIGALVVALGLLIANFDKIKGIVTGQSKAAEKAAEKEVALTSAIQKQFDARLTAAKQVLEFAKQKNALDKDALDLARAELEYSQSESLAAFAKLKSLKAENDLIDAKLKKRRGLSTEERSELARQKEINEELIRGLEFDNVRLKVVNLQKLNYTFIANQIEKQNELIRKTQISITKISAEQFNQRKLYLENKKIIETQLKIINTTWSIEQLRTDELRNQKEQLEAQLYAINEQEKLRIKNLKIQIQELNLSRQFENALSNINAEYTKLATALELERGYLESNVIAYEDQIYSLEVIKSKHDELRDKKMDLVNFDARGKGLLYQQNQELEQQLLNYNELFSQARGILDLQVEFVNSRIRESKLFEEKLDAAARELMFFTQIEEAQQDKLRNDKQILENQKEGLNQKKEELSLIGQQYEQQEQIYQQALDKANAELSSASSLEEQANALQKVVAAEQQLATLNQNVLDTNLQIEQTKSEILAVDNDIITTEINIEASTNAVLQKQKELSDEVERGARGYILAQEQLQKYAEEIAATQQLISAGFELVASLYDRQAQNADDSLKKLNKQLQGIAKTESKLKELKEELKDADGERYDELIKRIADEEKAELAKNDSIDKQRIAIEEQIKEQENKKLEAEYQAAKWRKIQSLVDATIAGALAVVRALPNVVLAGIIGALAATNIGIISSQKLPERPKQELGGYQQGKSHAQGGIPVEVEGGEYIINKRSTSQYLPLLEAINNMGNRRKFADGGLTAPVSATSGGDIIDYDRLSKAILEGLQPQVSVKDIISGIRKVNVIEAKARLGS